MLRDLDILNIDYSASNEDYRRTEYHKTNELTGNFLIPYEGPMFARNLVVRADGAALAIETDYTLEDDFEELELMTGKKVIGCIKLSNRILNDYKEVKIVYQKVGEVILSRKFFLDSADKIINNDRPVDWLTKIFGKPDTYPPAFHIHDIREKDELVGFSDLLLLFKQASGDIKRSGLEIWNGLKVLEDKAFKDLDETNKALWNAIFKHVMDVTNPHKITKSDLDLSDHPNYGTATLEEDQAAGYYTYPDSHLRGDVISTPHGVKSAIDNYDVNTDGYVRQGALPFSYYGSGFYLPPPIKGSFEGLGSDIGTGCGCLESNGVFTVLTRGYDSKVKSLYYYYKKNPYDVNDKFIFSGVKYDHPLVAADNEALLQAYKNSHNGSSDGYVPLELNHVVSGSSGLILLLGDNSKNKYYIGLGNGTLDYNSHVLKRIDIENFNDKKEGQVFDSYRSCVMLIGDYVYIIAQTNRWPSATPESAKFGEKSPIYRMRIFYRANKADLSDNGNDNIKFEQITITYTDTDEITHKNAKTIDFFPFTIGKTSDGKDYCQRLMVDWEVQDPTFTRIFLTPYHCQWVYKENPSNKTKATIRMLHGIQYWYYGVRTIGTNMWCALPLEFDTTTNTITIDERWFRIKYNVIDDTRTPPKGRELSEWYHNNLNNFIANFDEVGCAWIDRIGYYSLGTRVHGLPYVNTFWYNTNYELKGNTDQWELFNQNYTDMGVGYSATAVLMESPFGFTSMPAYLCDVWQVDSTLRNTPIELFKSLDANNSTDNFYRIADDSAYQKNDDLKFPYIGKDIYARNPNANFGKYRLENVTDGNDRYLPSIFIAGRDARSVQYGAFRIFDCYNDGTYPRYYNEMYNLSAVKKTDNVMDSNGGFYIDTLGTHSLDIENNLLTISPDKSGRLWITKDFWRGMLKILLGSNDAIAGTNGINGKGEYTLSVFIAQPLANNSAVPRSMAHVVWHEVSTDSTVAQQAHTSFMFFDWTSSGKNSEGYVIPKITSYEFPSKDHGGSGDGGSYSSGNFQRETTGKWGYRTPNHNFPSVATAVQIYGTDRNNYACSFSTGVQHGTIGGACTPGFVCKKVNGVYTETTALYTGIYTIGGTSGTYQAIHGVGLTNVITGTESGGSALYSQMPDGKSYALLEAVFVKGNWTLFIGSDLEVMFNGYTRTLKARNYALDQLGINPANKTFYLYAVCGKTEGYYDLSLSERTASPYHMLIATIVTISTGIKTIDINQVFAISGFSISTKNRGGIVPATTGTFPEVGNLSAVVKEDLFDDSKY